MLEFNYNGMSPLHPPEEEWATTDLHFDLVRETIQNTENFEEALRT